MNSKLKTILVISAKQAVNALMVNGVFTSLNGKWSELTTLPGLITFAKIAAATVIAREVLVWGPKVYAWSKTSGGDQ